MDNKRLTKLVSYFVLGDGGVYRYGNQTNAKFIMNMKEENKDYIEWVKSTIEEFTGCSLYRRKDYNTDGCTRQPQLRLESKAHPMFTKLRDRIYTADNHKGLDMHTLKLLDWEAMAILFMCDGNTYVDFRSNIGMVNPSINVTLNMKRLSEAEQVVLKQTIRNNLGVEFNVQHQGKYFYLRLRTKDVAKFLEGVAPYVCESFKYKLSVQLAPERGGDIVCTSGQPEEVSRNDLSL